MRTYVSLKPSSTYVFKAVRKQVTVGKNPLKKKGFDFILEPNMETMRKNFRALGCLLPNTPGILVISGVGGKTDITTLKVVRSDESLRASFSTLWNSCFQNFCEQLLTNTFKEIRFEIGMAVNQPF